jgi:hypothetical protein
LLIQRGVRPTGHFTKIANGALRDSKLSFRARGLLGYILSQKDGWTVDSERLTDASDVEGRDAIRSGLRELERLGYLTRERHRGPGGRWVWTGTVTDVPAVQTIDWKTGAGQPSVVSQAITTRRRTSKEEEPLSSSSPAGEVIPISEGIAIARAALRSSRSVTIPVPSKKSRKE